MKKILNILMLIIFVLLCGCASSEEIVPEFDASGDVIDMKGLVIKASRDEGTFADTYLGYRQGSLLYDAALERVRSVEAKYNCSIEFVSDNNLVSTISLRSAAGYAYIDFALMTRYNRNLTQSGLLTPLSQLSDFIDYYDHDKWGTPNTLFQLVWDGELYGVIPVSWPEYYFTLVDFPIVSNTNKIRSMGFPDPREYVENGEWTRDRFADCVNDYCYSDGSTVHYGLSMYKPHFYDMAIRASGVAMAVKTENGWESGIHSPTGREAIAWAIDFVQFRCKVSINDEDNETQAALVAFCNGKSSLVLNHSNYLFASNSQYEKVVAYEVENFGVLPFPLGPEVEYGQWIGQYERTPNTLIFPVIANNTDAAAIVANDIFEPLDDYPDTASLEDYYYENIFFDKRDVSVIMQMLRNSRYNFYDEGLRQISDKLGSGNNDADQLLDSMADVYYNLIQEKVVPVYESIESIFGE